MNSYNYTTKKIPASPRNKRLTDSILSAASTGGFYVGSAPSYWSLVGDMIVSNYSAASTGDIIAYLEGKQTSNLPIASPSNYGLVKYDGTTLKVDDEGRLYVSGGGSSGIDFTVGAGLELTPNKYLNVLFGTTSKTACEGNDARLSDARRNPYSLSWSGYSSGSYDGASVAKIEIPNNTNQLTNGAGFISDANGFISKIYGTGHANQYLAGDGRFYTIAYSELSGTPDLSVFVTLNTDQTITGLKTFEQNILSKQDIIAYSDSTKFPTLPIASASSYGLVKIDGVTLQYDGNGRLYVAGGGSGGGISSVIPSGSGNAVTGLQYDSQSKTLTYQLDNSFLPISGGTMNNTNLVGNLNADMLDGLHSNEFLIKGPRVYSKEDFDTRYRFASMYSTDYMSPVDGAYNYGQVLSFVDNCSTTQFYCPDNTGLIYFRNSWGTDSKGSENFANIPWYEIITSKNIGSQTVANSHALEGIRILDLPGFLFGNRSYKTIPAGADLNNYQEGIYQSLDSTDYINAPYQNFGLISVSLNSQYVGQLMLPYFEHKKLAYRCFMYKSGELLWTDWKYIMFDGDTAASANKLSTTRYLWGQPFDGSDNVVGDLFLTKTSLSDSNNEAGKLFFGGSNSTNHGVYLSATKCDTYGRKRFGIFTTNAASDTPNWVESFSITPDGRVGIGIVEPEHTLDVNGSSIFRNHVFVKKHHHIFMNAGGEGVYYTSDGLYWHNANNAYVRHLIKFDSSGNASFTENISMNSSDQINGEWDGLALNYNCGKYVNTSIWDGQANPIMRVFGEGRQVAIGAHSIDTPRGTLNVDGEVIFEQSRFTTTSGFVYGDHAYSHAIYGGYHGIDVCEFYENEFRFKTNGGDITSFTLNRYYATFNGTVMSLNCNFTGTWNSRERFRLIRDGEYNTWLQAGTDTTKEGGRLCMSGHSATLLSEFNVYASKSTFSGNIIANGDVTAYSDIRLKNRIESVNNVLDTINTLDVFRYTWKDSEDKSVHIGVSAQQVQTIYPEFVITSNSEDGTDYLTVNYAALATCIAIQGIKELAKKGDERDKKIVSLETEIKNLKERIKTLEAWS